MPLPSRERQLDDLLCVTGLHADERHDRNKTISAEAQIAARPTWSVISLNPVTDSG